VPVGERRLAELERLHRDPEGAADDQPRDGLERRLRATGIVLKKRADGEAGRADAPPTGRRR
jgi:hypothetical protein